MMFSMHIGLQEKQSVCFMENPPLEPLEKAIWRDKTCISCKYYWKIISPDKTILNSADGKVPPSNF